MIEDFGRNPRGEPWRHQWRDDLSYGVTCWADRDREVQLWKRSMVSFSHKFDPTATDCGPLEAYCRGDMPAHVFADWVEENATDFPAEGLAILRADLG